MRSGELAPPSMTGPADIQTETVSRTTGVEDSRIGGAAERPAAGTLVGRYQLLDVLGEGGMGVVYRAHDPYLSRNIALKVIAAGGGGSRDRSQARLLREAQALAKLSHPNVVAAFDVGQHTAGVFIAMELIEGAPLGRWLERAHPIREVLRVLIAAGRGLAAAHAAGVMHRDFKPGNVMISPDGRVRVVDFGLARALGGADERDPDAVDPAGPTEPAGMTAREEPRASPEGSEHVSFLAIDLSTVGAVMGTAGYMSPEQLVGDPIDARSDQFAYAATAFVALAGHLAYPSTSLDAYRAAVIVGRRTPWPRRVPRRLRRIVERGLSVEPGARFASVAAMVDALERAGRMPRVVLAGAAAASVAAVIAAVIAVRPAAVAPACVADDSTFDGAWSAIRRRDLARAFSATGYPGHDSSATLVANHLDGVRARWLAMGQAACEDTHVRHRQSERMLALRTTCLARKRGEVATFIDALTRDAGGALIERAPTAVLEVGQLDDCADSALLVDGDDRLPADPDRRAAVGALIDRLDTVHVISLAGRDAQVLPQIEALVGQADQLGHAVTRARARLELGIVQLGMARDAAQRTLRDALRIAGAADARRIFAEVSLRLLHAAIVDDRFAEAAHVLPFVEAVVDAAIPSRLAIQLLVDEAAIHANDAAYDDALRVLARAEAHADALGDAARFERIRIVNEIAFTLDARGDAAGAERNFRAALELTRTLLGPRHRSVLKSYGNLVSSLTSLGRHDEAQATLREARSLTAGYPAATAEVINLEAVEAADWQARGNLERALVHFEAALAGYSSSLGPTAPPAIRIHIRIGKCLIALHRAADAVPHFEVWLARKVAEHATADFQAEAGFWLAQALWATPRQRGRAMATAETALARYHEAGTGYTAEAAEIVRWIAGHRGR